MAASQSAAATVRRGSGAAYRQIARELRHRIADGEFDQDERLPTEEDLMAEYAVSRHTVRAAMAVLVADGLVERYAGRGTFLAERGPDAAAWRIRSLDDIVNESFSADPSLVENIWLHGKDDREAARELDLLPGDEMLRITAVRRGAEGPLACSQIFVPPEVGRRIEAEIAAHLGRQPIVRLIETVLGLRANRAVQVATMRTPPRIVAEALGEPGGRMTIALLRTYMSRDGQPFEFSRLYGKPGAFRNVIEFSRQEMTGSH